MTLYKFWIALYNMRVTACYRYTLSSYKNPIKRIRFSEFPNLSSNFSNRKFEFIFFICEHFKNI